MNPLGAQGEHLAAAYLQGLGYRLLHRNLKLGAAEVDLIAQQGEELVFVEVKTSWGLHATPPENNVTASKQRFLARAAHRYLQRYSTPPLLRFDVVAVRLLQNQPPEIVHYPDAFTPNLLLG